MESRRDDAFFSRRKAEPYRVSDLSDPPRRDRESLKCLKARKSWRDSGNASFAWNGFSSAKIGPRSFVYRATSAARIRVSVINSASLDLGTRLMRL